MGSGSYSRCCCCSFKSISIFIVGIAIFVKVINPMLDHWIVGADDDSNNNHNETSAPFDPAMTDILNYTQLGFLREGEEAELHLGLTYILRQSVPKWVTKLLERYETPMNHSTYQNQTLDILDARRQPHLTFEQTGFTLIDLQDAPSLKTVKNWRSQTDIKAFQDDLEPHLRKLFPEATRIEYTYNVVRGGSQFGDQPAAINAPHLDYSQNDSARVEFHKVYPTFAQSKEHAVLLQEEDTDEEEAKVLLGIWKPIGMAHPVCDHPLAVMDASTFAPEQEAPHPIHIDFGVFTFHNLNGAIRYAPQQQWYYYSLQRDSEVLVFTQYSRDKHFSNPHASFENTNCPANFSESRISVEMRAAVFTKKEKE